MYGHRWLPSLFLAMAMLALAGCRGTGSRNSLASPEPGLTGALEPKTQIVEGPQAKSVTYVDRHPILSKPRDYWESSGDNKIVKAAAATFVGVPAGIFGEVKQIVVGAPAEVR